MVEEAVTASAEVVAPPLKLKLRPVMRPVFEIEKSVEVANAEVVLPIANSVVGETTAPPVVAALANTERSAYGEDVPTPTLPERNEIFELVEVAANHGPVGALKRPAQFLLRLAVEVIGAR